jgi:D-alanyl-D-alanine dipeptidase
MRRLFLGLLLLPLAANAEPELVDVRILIPDLVVDLRYATPNNVFREAVYPEGARCLLLRPTAERLARVARRLREEDGTRLRVFDCYRPHSVQFRLWEIMPVRGYVAPPRPGSVHNRGGAVDLTLASPSGEPLPMPTDFDELTERAWHAYEDATPEQKRNRARLKAAMEAEGFRSIRKEWWHYEDPAARQAPVRDLPLDR